MRVTVENGMKPTPCGKRKAAVARILLADSDLASRLTLKSLLTKAGYAVDGAATASEAVGKLDTGEYQLVLADLRNEAGDAGEAVLSYARQKDFLPATALILSDLIATHTPDAGLVNGDSIVRMSHEDVCYLLATVADLIGNRADRRLRRSLRRAS
jgi:CheY-like chemotaxis protein